MQTIRREIHPTIRILDARDGLVEFVASDETVDSYQEVIKVSGWKFNHFQKNAPVVDSHNYSSIEFLLGKVIEYKVIGKKLVETVQFAVDVPEQKLASITFKMVQAGYLKAVSVGFWPIKSVSRWDSNSLPYHDEVKRLGLRKGQ